jgi:predicted ATPase
MAGASPGNDQNHINELVTTVLVALARKRPLILILDDLQWIDESSASPLFHLARRIEGGYYQRVRKITLRHSQFIILMILSVIMNRTLYALISMSPS